MEHRHTIPSMAVCWSVMLSLECAATEQNIGFLANNGAGFEAIVHMAEETKNAKLAVPRGMIWSIFSNGILGFIMLFTFLVSGTEYYAA